MRQAQSSRRADHLFCVNWRNRDCEAWTTVQAVVNIRVALVDDHTVFAEALAALLDAEPGLNVVATATSLDAARHMLARNRVDVVLLDLDIDGDNGLRLLDEHDDGERDVRFIVVTGLEDPGVLSDAVRRGVAGWVTKEVGVQELVHVIVGVHAGETHVPPLMLTGLLRSLRVIDGEIEQSQRLISTLSRRERDVLRLMTVGMSRNTIANSLQLSPNTVRTHAQHVLHKLEVHTALGAAAIARSAHLDQDT